MSEEATTPIAATDATTATDQTAGQSAASEKDQSAAETDWKAEARKWEARAKDNAAKLKAAEPKLSEYDKLLEDNRSDLERAQVAAQSATERASQYQTRAVQAEVKALASTGFADPEDAAAFLDTGAYISDAGEIDTSKIAADLAALLERKPHLGKTETRRLPAPNQAQGANAFGGSPTLDDQMAAAVKNGDWKEQIRIQNLKLAALPR